MVFESLSKILGVRKKPDPREALGLLEAVPAEEGEQSGAPYELYTLLEDEKIPRELWPYILGYIVRDTKLTYFTPSDEKYLFWKSEAIATRIEMTLNSLTDPPDRYPSLKDYTKDVMANQLLAQNLRVLMLAVIRRSTLGFERRLQATKHYYVGYAPSTGR